MIEFPSYWIKSWVVAGLIWLWIYGIIEVVKDTINKNTIEDVDNTEADYD
jgi:hypothetical protein